MEFMLKSEMAIKKGLISFKQTHLSFSGSFELGDDDFVTLKYLKDIQLQILNQESIKVTVDFSTLEFINSKGIRFFANWINKLKKMPSEHQYEIIFICNTEYQWQESVVNTLSYLYLDKIKVLFS
ncbi:MAG: hypothetical protein MJB14_00555 [Spirochaetes bacterium]|nr:hypothetical protein [Spirochaetota bacterium]